MIFSKANFGTFSTSLAIQTCGAGTGVLTARILGPVARGELATVILWPVILSNLGLMGCNWALARVVAREPQRESEWVAVGVAVGMASATLYLLAGYFLMPLLLPTERVYLLPVARLALLLIPLDIFNQILLSVDHGRMRWRRYNMLRLSFFLFYLGSIGLIGLSRQIEVRWFVIALLASHFLAVLLRFWIQRKCIAAARVRFAEFRYLLRAGLPYFGATASNLASLQFDTILVVSLLNTEAAGIYAIASALANGQSSLGDALGITSFAVASNEASFGGLAKIITETFRQAALASCGVGLALSCLIPFCVVPLFGRGFAPAIWLAVILAMAASTTASAGILNQGLRGAGRPHAGIASQILGIAAVALAALFLMRRFGIAGIALAVMLGGCTQLIVLVFAAAKWLNISPLEFWPFGFGNLRAFFRQLAGLRLRDSRSPA